MRLSLMPQSRIFFELLEKAADNMVETAELYAKMLQGYDERTRFVQEIRDREHRGDELTHEIMRELNQSFVTPIDRDDIHALASSLDDVADLVEAAADNHILHQIDEPMPAEREQAEVLVRACASVRDAVALLSRFKGLDVHLSSVHSIEKEGDQVFRRAIAELFSGDHKAMEVLKHKEIYDEIEAAIDGCERVASEIEAVALKHT